MRNKYKCKREFVWNVHIQVMLKANSCSILNMHELVKTWLPEAYFLKFPDWQSNVHFPDQMNCMAKNHGHHIPWILYSGGLTILLTTDFELLIFAWRALILDRSSCGISSRFVPNKSRLLKILPKQAMTKDCRWNKLLTHRLWSKLKQIKAEISLLKTVDFGDFRVRFQFALDSVITVFTGHYVDFQEWAPQTEKIGRKRD